MGVELASISPLVQEQIPVESWGTQALTVGFAGRTNGDTYRVLAAYDGTVVSVTGTIVSLDTNTDPTTVTGMTNETVSFTTNAGGFFDVLLEGPALFQANQPIQVAHFANGATFESLTNQEGDPTEILLPPTGQYLTTNIVYVPNVSDYLFYDINTNFLNLIVSQSATNRTTIDGTLVAATNFVSITNSGYFGARLSVTNGVHTIISSQPVGLELYGFGRFDAYGYFGGVAK